MTTAIDRGGPGFGPERPAIDHAGHLLVAFFSPADRIVVLRRGVIEQVGTPEEIYDKPCNRFVAGFMGAPKMSFLESSVIGSNGRSSILSVPGTVDGNVELELETPGVPDGPVVIGLRPEHFNVRQPVGPKVRAERLGGESFLHAPTHPAGSLIMRQGDDDGARTGTGPHSIGVNWRRAHLFAPDGTAIPILRGSQRQQWRPVQPTNERRTASQPAGMRR